MAKIRKSAQMIFLWVVSFFLLFSFSYHIYMAYYFSSNWTNKPFLWLSFFVLGFFTTPIAYQVSHSKNYKKLIALTWAGYIWLGFFFILAAYTIPYQFASAVWPNLGERRFEWFLSLLVLSIYSLYRGLEFPQIVTHKIKVENQNLKGLRMVQITDLHVGQLQHNGDWLKKVIEQCNSLKPDFLFLTGDLVEASPYQIRDDLKILTHAEAKIDRIFVLGNHEMIHGGVDWENTLRDLNWTAMHNDHKIYSINNTSVQVAGVPDRMINRFDPKYNSDPEKALTTNVPIDYRILLAHEPSSIKDIKSIKPDLLLSGHTHAGQIFPFNWLVRLVQPVVGGWKKIEGVQVFAHPGTGLWGPPMRLGSRNQIVVIELI